MNNSVSQVQDRLSTGDAAGDMIVIQCQGSVLELASPQRLPIALAIVGVAGMVTWLVMAMMQLKAAGIWFIVWISSQCIVVPACVAIVIAKRLGLSYTISGDDRSVTRWRPWATRCWLAADIDTVAVEITHRDVDEVLCLSLRLRGGKSVSLARSPSDTRGRSLVAVAQRVSQLLGIPPSQFGEIVQGDKRLCLQLAGEQPSIGAGDGRDLIIHCPACGVRNAKAVAYDEYEEMFHGLLKSRCTWVKCLDCGEKLFSKRSADNLAGLSTDQLQGIIAKSFSGGPVAIVAILVAIVPVAGVIAALCALLMNWQTHGWKKTLSVVAVVVSLVVSAAVAIMVDM
ncbi:MAG: hypothetical protein ABSH20_08155 [Tepidisphaeraceae bacterium]|jgi:hypothetical protein